MNILNMIQQNDMLKVVLVLLVVYFFMKYYNKENLDNVSVSMPLAQGNIPMLTHGNALKETPQQIQMDKIVAGPTQLTTNDLLPAYDDANDFAKQNPVSKLLQEQNFLQSGYHAGINTVVQSNKIASLDIRSTPPIVKQSVGPFMNSSYETPVGFGRRQFEIGI